MKPFLSTLEKKGIDDFKLRVLKKFPRKIKNFILIGSKARGNASQESDVDIVVIATEDNQNLIDEIQSVAYEIEEKYNYTFLLSVKVVAEKIFFSKEPDYDPFFHNVKEEGISL